MSDIKDDAADLAAAATEGNQTSILPAHVREHAAYQLQHAAALIADTTPDCEAWNLKEAGQCIRAALRSLAFGGGK